MKKLRLLNTSEYYAEKALRKALKGTRFRVFAQLPLSKVIQREKGESLSRGERTLLAASELDFVVYDENSEPVFAIEFDGSAHDYTEQKERDLRKNKVCQKADLPLLRITDEYLEEYEKITLLEFVIQRFVSWDIEKDELIQEMYDNISLLNNEEFQEISQGGILDPSIDPTVIFDINHPFPAIEETAKRLLQDFGIISNYHSPKTLEKIIDDCPYRYLDRGMSMEHGEKFVVRKKYELAKISGKKTLVNIHEGEIKFGLQWILPLTDDLSEEESFFEYRARTGKIPYSFQDIPGASIPEIAEQMCEYLCLRDVESWAKENILK